MSVVGGIIIYLLIWWCVLFTFLPMNIRSVWEEKDQHMYGVDQGAPVDPQMRKKLLRTSWVSAVIWVIVAVIMSSGIIDFHQ